MLFLILGTLNGCCIALSRILNGQLSISRGAFSASFINHFIGFLFLSALVSFLALPLQALPQEPYLYLGGLVGALYVAINSFVIVRLGSTSSIVLVVSGQMLFALIVEAYRFGIANLNIQIFGAALIVVGVILKGHSLKVVAKNDNSCVKIRS